MPEIRHFNLSALVNNLYACSLGHVVGQGSMVEEIGPQAPVHVAVVLHEANVALLHPLKTKGNMLHFVACLSRPTGKIKASQVIELAG
jgi:hypothetical protein